MNATPVSGALESLIQRIPGFGGYRISEQRRQDDRITRDYLASRIQDCKTALEKRLQPLIERGQLDAVFQGENLRSAMNHQQARVRSAVEGYSSWFEAKQIDAAQLSHVAQLDSDLIGLIDRLQSVIESHVQVIEPRVDSLFDLAQATEMLELFSQRFDRRRELLQK